MAASSKASTPLSETKLVQELADILDKSGLSELEYETDAVTIRLSRVTGVVPVRAAAPEVSATATATPTPSPSDAAAANPAEQKGAVTSPMVGTVYTAPEPGADGFISEGDTVKVGQTLFIVEAMKVMNPITAPTAGTVTKIFVQNAQPVECGEALAIVD